MKLAALSRYRPRPRRRVTTEVLPRAVFVLTSVARQCIDQLCQFHEVSRAALVPMLVTRLTSERGMADELRQFVQANQIASDGFTSLAVALPKDVLDDLNRLSFRLGCMGNRSATLRSLVVFLAVQDGLAETVANKALVPQIALV